MLSGQLQYLCMRNWSRSTQLFILNIFEKILLRIVTNSYVSSSFLLFLQNNLSSQCDSSDIGITSQIRSFSILWRFYLTLECVTIQSIEDYSYHTISNSFIYKDIERRLILLFRGDELNQGDEGEEVIVGRNINILQGMLRRKEIWMESSLGNLILLHLRLERYKKSYKEEQYKNEFNLFLNKNLLIEEERNIIEQLINAMIKREIEYRN